MRVLVALFTAGLMSALAMPAVADFTPIPLTIHENAGVARSLDPVTTGVPIPREAGLRDTSRLRVVSSNGSEMDAQFRVLSRWYAATEDESAPIRWLLVDLQANVPANGTAQVVLRDDGPQGPIAAPLAVTDGPRGVVVSTGAATFRIARDKFNLFDGVGIDADRDGQVDDELVPEHSEGGLVVEREDGSTYRSTGDGPPTSVRIEEQGPMRTVVRVDGRLRTQTQNDAYSGALDVLEYTARYHFYRGKSNVRVVFTLRNPDRVKAIDFHAGGAEVFHSFNDATLRLPVSLGANKSFTFVGDGVSEGALVGSDSAEIYQDSSGGPSWGPASDGSPYWSTTFQGYRVATATGASAPIVDAGLRALGVGDVSDERAGVAVSMRDFWQNFPKGIRVDPAGAIEMSLFPREWASAHRLRGGVQKSHDLLFQFHSGTARAASVESTARAFQAPLQALATPETYRDSHALGYFSVEDPSPDFRNYEEGMEAVIEYHGGRTDIQGDIYREMEEKDEYGWLNWGDHYRAGYKALRYWGNNEFDFSWILLLGYVRRPAHDVRYWELGQAAARHLMDVDIYHTGRDIFWANHGMKKHDASGSIDHGRDPNLSHFWIDGLILYYWMTGDEAARDSMNEIGQWLKNREEDPVHAPGLFAYAGEIRSKGWVMSALTGLFECTGDHSYLELANRFVAAEVVPRVSPEGWMSNSIGLVDPWMHGYVTEGLGRYLMVAGALGEGSDTYRDALLRILNFQITMAWDESRGEMAYTWDPATHSAISFSSNDSQTAVNGMVYAYLITGGTRYIEWARRCYDSYYHYRGYPYYYSITLQTPAKNAGFRLRFGQAWMWLAQTESVTGDRQQPFIEDARAEDVRWTHATLRFRTNERANAIVEYWPDNGPHTTARQGTFYRDHHVVELWNLTPGTTYHFTVNSADLAGNAATPASGSFRTTDPDVTPPVISELNFAGSAQRHARVRFTTDEASVARVEFGATAAYGQSASDSTDMARQHEIDFPVQPDTVYHFRVRATDRWGNSSTSTDDVFRSAARVKIPVAVDAHLKANYGGTGVYTNGSIEVRDNAGLHYDGFLWFDLRTIPPDATIVKASLQITKQSSGAWSPTVTLRGVVRNANSLEVQYPSLGFDPEDICYAYRDKSAQVCWTPTGQGADGAMGPVVARFQTFRFENRTYDVDVTRLVSQWMSGTMRNEGMFLEMHGTGQMVQFRSMEDPNPASRPRLEIIYQREP
ncbi:MAG: DNRLRE domain-containing protein [Planctomycetes bacterium]|nr:DNRLRE domain-containing protein [Planctomycetota bacterium]MBI3848575.1 DNRLRE domain-containing protein [Planctomycetota bacterium]